MILAATSSKMEDVLNVLMDTTSTYSVNACKFLPVAAISIILTMYASDVSQATLSIQEANVLSVRQVESLTLTANNSKMVNAYNAHKAPILILLANVSSLIHFVRNSMQPRRDVNSAILDLV